MSTTPQDAVVRRSFLARLAAVGTAIAGVVALPSTSAAEPSRAPTHPADAWLDDFKGQHKNIYDCTSVENGPMGWTFARNFLTANTGPIYQLKDSDINAIVSVRHSASVYGFNDAMWAKYKLGESQKVNDSAGAPAVKNPQVNVANDLAKRGVIVTVCGLAVARISRSVASDAGVTAADVEGSATTPAIAVPTAARRARKERRTTVSCVEVLM